MQQISRVKSALGEVGDERKSALPFFLSDDFKTLDYNSYTNNAQMGVEWTMYPDQQSGPCQTKSVLKLLPPEGAEGAQISLTFADEEQGWVFNLGDSPHNNGYGKFHRIWQRPVHRGRLRNNHFIYIKSQPIPSLEPFLLRDNHCGPSVQSFIVGYEIKIPIGGLIE